MQNSATMRNSLGLNYEVRPRKDNRGVDLISDALPFGCLWYTQVSHAIGYAKHRSRFALRAAAQAASAARPGAAANHRRTAACLSSGCPQFAAKRISTQNPSFCP
jgi:hypothetical protein